MPVRSVLAIGETTPAWKTEMADAIRSVSELVALLELDRTGTHYGSAEGGFGVRVPHAYLCKMRKRDPDDPLLRQVLPLAMENAEDGMIDPVSDIAAMTAPGLLHKYSGRALLVTTGACAVHCRYCFRRHFPYSDANPLGRQHRDAMDYLRQHTELREVILSGGDPLMLDNGKLEELIEHIAEIDHVRWLRIHTRMPVVLPSRIEPGLVSLLERCRLRTTLVVHANHANEITHAEQRAFARLSAGNINLLNQSVLLRGVNDSSGALIELSERLYESGVLPYYLHMLDPVRGAMHFDVPASEAIQLIQTMRLSLPGFLVPRLVREDAGEKSKTTIFSI